MAFETPKQRVLEQAAACANSGADAALLRKHGTNADRVAFLFQRDQALTSLLPPAKARPARKRRAIEPAGDRGAIEAAGGWPLR